MLNRKRLSQLKVKLKVVTTTTTNGVPQVLAGLSMVVTGGASGIGKGIVLHAASKGCAVVYLDLRDTPLERIELPKKLVAKDGLLVESAVGTDGLPVDVEYNKARAAYLARRKARIDKEMHAKDRGGEINFRG